MSEKKYVSLNRLQEYDILIKGKIISGDESTLSNAKSHADNNLATAKTYTDNAVAQKTQVQIITWEADD